MTRDPEPTEDHAPDPADRATWLAALRDALHRASALVEEAHAAGRDTTEAEARIAVAFALLREVETGLEETPVAARSRR